MKRLAWLGLALLLLAAPLYAQAQDGYVTVNLNMRAGPDSDYPLITTLRAGTRISVQGCIDDYEWCDVIAYGERGWVYGDYIEYSWHNRRVPVYGYGAEIGIPIISFVFGDYWGRHYNHRPFYRDRDRWSRHTYHHRGPSRHHDSRRDYRGDNRHDRRDDRRDNRRDRRDDRRDDRHDRRDDRRDDRHDRRDDRRDDRDDNRGPRTSNARGRSEPTRQRAVEPRRTEVRLERVPNRSSRSEPERIQRQERSNQTRNVQQRDKRGSRDGGDRNQGKRDSGDKRSDDKKGDRQRH